MKGLPKNLNVAVVIRSDPRTTHRAGEGIRVALGLAASRHAVDIILTGLAPHLLAPDTEDHMDGEVTRSFLAALPSFAVQCIVEEDLGADLSGSPLYAERLSRVEIACRIARADRFMVF